MGGCDRRSGVTKIAPWGRRTQSGPAPSVESGYISASVHGLYFRPDVIQLRQNIFLPLLLGALLSAPSEAPMRAEAPLTEKDTVVLGRFIIRTTNRRF